MKSAKWCAGIALACVLFGCEAQVKAFTPTLRHICPGERVTLHWEVVGSATLSARPPVTGVPNGKVDEVGDVSIAPIQTTSVDLHVTRFLGSSTTRTQEIVVKTPAPKPEALTASVADAAAKPDCKDDKVWATVHANRFAADVKVASVAAHPGDPRTYDVQHAGIRAKVAPGIPATAFAGTPIGGDWLLTAMLEPAQTCGTPSVPNNVVVDVMTECTSGGGE